MEHPNNTDYSSGEDESEFAVPFSTLTPKEKALRSEYLWQAAYLRAHCSFIILHKFSQVHQNILVFGTTKNIYLDPTQAEREAYKKKSAWIILPDSKFSKFWSIVIMLLLSYTASFLPISVAFYD